ncbi:T-cell immunoglobulin and mucin domain-containing protein 4-like [Emydura macquarii macquarii]|uniref:T-cell immunoglobulin and mucin domain-containing protein 4-like n=1 Tax=Emydura macquarii macquarii TaxID=1129001 RepID=UPI00352A5374
MARSLLLRWIMLQLFIAHSVSDTSVRAMVGQSVKLPCTYSVRQESDLTTMCWGRGICPNSKCNSEIVHTDGQKMAFAKNDRYQLKGRITRGDVSLTISNVNREDRGAYCCRIEIPGWFNDIKRNLNLEVYEAPTTPPTTTTTTRPTPTTLTTTTTLPTPTTLTTTNGLPTTLPSLTTLQTTTVWTEDGFSFSTTELVLPPAVTTALISERTENVDTSLMTEGALRTVAAVSTAQTSTLRTDDGVTSHATESPLATGTVPPVTVQASPEASEVNGISNAIFPLTPSEDSVKEALREEPSTDSKLQSEESVDNPNQHPENEIPTIVICVVVTVILFFTSLLVISLADKRSRKYLLHAIKSSDSSGEPEEILGEMEGENNPLTPQQTPDCHSVSCETYHKPVESSI